MNYMANQRPLEASHFSAGRGASGHHGERAIYGEGADDGRVGAAMELA